MVQIFRGTNRGDAITGSSFEDSILIGRGGADRLTGSAFQDDLLFGGNGNDTLVQTGGTDVLRGGNGNDTYILDISREGSTILEEEENGGFDTLILQDGLFFFYDIPENVERLLIEAPVNSVQGSSRADIIDASNMPGITPFSVDGIDLDGGAGRDRLIGSSGADVLDGGRGADFLAGGDGFDFYIVDNVNDRVRESVDSGIDSVRASVDYTLTANVENLRLVGNATEGTGNGLDNSLTGNGRNNELSGQRGDDLLRGKNGNDRLNGNQGDDVLNGGNGRDILRGGSGSDVFEFIDVSELGTNRRNADRIVDLEDGDIISLFALGDDIDPNGFQSLEFIGRDAFSGDAGEVRFANGFLEFNLDDDLQADRFIRVGNDFALVEDAILV